MTKAQILNLSETMTQLAENASQDLEIKNNIKVSNPAGLATISMAFMEQFVPNIGDSATVYRSLVNEDGEITEKVSLVSDSATFADGNVLIEYSPLREPEPIPEDDFVLPDSDEEGSIDDEDLRDYDDHDIPDGDEDEDDGDEDEIPISVDNHTIDQSDDVAFTLNRMIQEHLSRYNVDMARLADLGIDLTDFAVQRDALNDQPLSFVDFYHWVKMLELDLDIYLGW